MEESFASDRISKYQGSSLGQTSIVPGIASLNAEGFEASREVAAVAGLNKGPCQGGLGGG
jgi:hypothetical protein